VIDSRAGGYFALGFKLAMMASGSHSVPPRKTTVKLFNLLAPTPGQYRPIRTGRAGGGGRGRCPLRPALPVPLPPPPPPPTATAIARPRSGLYCRLSTDLLLFDFVHAGCAHVSLASQTSQRLTNGYLTFVHFAYAQVVVALSLTAG
jgi:hypothetical protein